MSEPEEAADEAQRNANPPDTGLLADAAAAGAVQQEKPNDEAASQTTTNCQNTRGHVSYLSQFRNIGMDRHIELLLSVVIAAFAGCQFIITCSNNRSSSIQVGKIVESANRLSLSADRIDAAADSFARSTVSINTGIASASDNLEKARTSAESSSKNQQAILQTQLEMSERPLVIIRKIDTLRLNIANPKESIPPTIGWPIVSNIFYQSTGKTPALNVQVFRHLIVGDDAASSIKRDPVLKDGGSDMNPDEAPTVVSVETLIDESGVNPFFHLNRSNLKPWDGSMPIILYGEIVYEDRFKNTYCTPILQINQGGGLWTTTGHWRLKNGTRRSTGELCPTGSIR